MHPLLFHPRIGRPLCILALLPALARALTVAPASSGIDGPGLVSLSMVNGRPAIAWVDTDSRAVKFVRALDATGAAWGTPVTLDSSPSLKPDVSLRTANGRPSVLCFDDNAMRLIHAGDATGSTWNSAIVIGGPARDAVMEVIAGELAVLFSEGSTLKYLHAPNASHTASSAVQVTAAPTAGRPALTEFQGVPAAAWSSSTGIGGLYFARALDAAGTAWRAPRMVTATSWAASISLQVSGTEPVVSFLIPSLVPASLRYSRSYSLGDAWTSPQVVSQNARMSGVAHSPASLAIINGKPSVSFLTHSFDLGYAQAKDSLGSGDASWNAPSTIDNSGSTGFNPCLLEVNGSPAVAYIDISRGLLKYVRASDSALWPPKMVVQGSSAFGVVRVGASKTLRLTILNPETADASLNITGVTLDGPDAAEFSILTHPDTPIAGGGSTEFILAYAPLTPGLKTATLHIASDSVFNSNPFDFTLTGDSSPQISVETSGGSLIEDERDVILHATAAGAQASFVFRVKNPGGADLSGLAVSIDDPDGTEFSVTSAPAPVVAPGESTTFTVRHAPLTGGRKNAVFHIASNVTEGKNPYDIYARLELGVLDDSFAPSNGTQFTSLAVQPDGRILAGGRALLMAFTPEGSSDTSFFSPSVDNSIFSIAVQRDGKILLGGNFNHVGGLSRSCLARLLPDGTVDPSFDARMAPPGGFGVQCIAIQPDGKIIAAGDFQSVAGATHRFMVRVHTDGSLDNSFNPVFDRAVLALSLLPDGSTLAGGQFTSVPSGNGYLTRINPDGTRSPFPYQISSPVSAVAWRPDGFIFAASEKTGLVRLTPDGLIAPGGDNLLPYRFVRDLAMQVNGGCLAAGDSFPVFPPLQRGIFYMGVNVTENYVFSADPEGFVRNLALQADGRVLIAGSFSSVSGAERPGIARLTNDAAISTLTRTGNTAVRWMRGGAAPEVSDVSFEMNPPGESAWSLLGFASRIPGGWELTGLNLPASCQIRARGRTGGSLVESIATLLSPLESWRLNYFNSPDNTGPAADDADPDHDGLANFTEFAFGLDPTDRASNNLPEFKYSNNSFAATFTAPQGREDVVYTAESSPSMLPGTWVPVPDTGTAPAHRFTLSATANRLFTRFTVQMR